ncbi:GH15334 [Drosophila grimshawi]|uniref:GH15334 n=1 Tax=Drosophila grimshawi TaxID=7222 RepID=B4J3L4_DROGR|nr:GH15334 [Drosophila grimshawi]
MLPAHKCKQQAQERLHRLQTGLKHVSSKRADKEKHMSTRISSRKCSNTNSSSSSPPGSSTTASRNSPAKTHRNSWSSSAFTSHSPTKTHRSSNSIKSRSTLQSSSITTSGHSLHKTHRKSNNNRSRSRSPRRTSSTTASSSSPAKTPSNSTERLKQAKGSSDTLKSFCLNERPTLVQPALAIFSPPKSDAYETSSKRINTDRGSGRSCGMSSDIGSGVRNTWAKPKALLDASNRLGSTRSISANQRLLLLCESLQQRQMDNNNNNNHGIETPSPTIKLPAVDNAINRNPKPNCVQSMDDVEPMDVDSEEDIKAVSNNTTLVAAVKQDVNTNSFANKSMQVDKSGITVNRLLAIGKKLPARCLDHMYFVLDTNVLVHNLAFVEDVCQLALGGTEGSILFIPYIVIKELDNLNNRRNDKHLNHDAAMRAIRYLNKKFDNSLNIQAQSALEEADHLIEVDCPDDSIVNCCLQLRRQVPHLTLLTNDNNLRLKGIASEIEVSCRSDLINSYREQFDALSP